MTHPMQMSVSLTGWSIDPELLDDMAIELHHSEQFGDVFTIKLKWKSGRETAIDAELKDATGNMLYVRLAAEIATPTKTVIEHEGG
jgi:hypothetical protein